MRGGAIAVATVGAPIVTAVVLRSPFTDLAAAAGELFPWLPARWMLRDEFLVAEPVAALRTPLTAIYGERDGLIPPEQSLAAPAATTARAVDVPRADHHDATLVIDAVVNVARVGRRPRPGNFQLSAAARNASA